MRARWIAIAFTATLQMATVARGSTVLTYLGAARLDGDAEPQDLLLSADGTCLYLADSGRDVVEVYSREPATGQLSSIQSLGAGVNLPNPRSLALSPDERHLYVLGAYVVVNESFTVIAVLARDPATGLLSYSSSVPSDGSARRVVVSPDGLHVYAVSSDSGPGDPVLFGRDPSSGALTQLPSPDNLFDSDEDLVFSADGLTAYLIGMYREVDHVAGGFRINDSVRVWVATRDPSTGAWRRRRLLRSAAGRGVAGALAPDGGQLYVSGTDGLIGPVPSFSGGSASTFFLPSGSSEFHAQGKHGIPPLGGADVAATASDVYLASGVVGGDTSGSLVHLRRSANGSTRYVETFKGLPAPSSVAVSPDQRDIYTAGFFFDGTPHRSFDVLREESVCPAQPRTDCHPATRATLTLRWGVKHSLRYRWDNEATSFPFSGDPWGGTTYSMCLYGDAAGTPTLLLAAAAPQGRIAAGRGWTREGSGTAVTKHSYHDPWGTPDGIAMARLERQRVRLAGRGDFLPAPSAPPAAPVTAQVVGNLGECWTAQFDADDVRVSDASGGRFVARYAP